MYLRLTKILHSQLHLIKLNATRLEAISWYNIARKVRISSSITFKELAVWCDLYEPDIRRIVRFAVAHYFLFREPQKGIVAYSAASIAQDGLGVMFEDRY